MAFPSCTFNSPVFGEIEEPGAGAFNLELGLEDGGVVDQGSIKLLEMEEVEGSGYWDENEASNNRWKQPRTLKNSIGQPRPTMTAHGCSRPRFHTDELRRHCITMIGFLVPCRLSDEREQGINTWQELESESADGFVIARLRGFGRGAFL
ncbi:hypothetical protein CKAH01_12896 [Colletotrichum kahawae]|uniref:Uncharacterized protein n=1 Tax=Colletotrichum kahawae TaxID=34407 RepID=A0AAD9YRD9_COLKA|nr:hypothetical protein CKAH01_12896 [Colletotrichum kahawae]